MPDGLFGGQASVANAGLVPGLKNLIYPRRVKRSDKSIQLGGESINDEIHIVFRHKKIRSQFPDSGLSLAGRIV